MTKFHKRFKEIMANSVFCYSKDGGQGFVIKDKCQCSEVGAIRCQAYEDQKLFHSYFDGVDYEDVPKVYFETIEKTLQDEQLKDSKWCRENVVAFKNLDKQNTEGDV